MGREAQADESFEGMPDDLARLAVQRLMTADVRRRAYNRKAQWWQAVATVISWLAAVFSTLAALTFIQEYETLGVVFAIGVALLVPTHNTLAASTRAQQNTASAGRYESLANNYERYTQLDIGPPLWQRERTFDLRRIRTILTVLDTQLAGAGENAPRVRISESDMVGAEARGNNLIEYLTNIEGDLRYSEETKRNIKMPPRAVWAV